jgi:hypothetical protein
MTTKVPPKKNQGAEVMIRTELAFEAHVLLSDMIVVGPSAHGFRRVVPITGGTFEGPRVRGRVLPSGQDHQFIRPDGVLELEARYVLETDDGVPIVVVNRGLRRASAEVIERLTRGEIVPASEYYFRTCAQFEAPLVSPYAWLNAALFIGQAERLPNAALVRFYEVL